MDRSGSKKRNSAGIAFQFIEETVCEVKSKNGEVVEVKINGQLYDLTPKTECLTEPADDPDCKPEKRYKKKQA